MSKDQVSNLPDFKSMNEWLDLQSKEATKNHSGNGLEVADRIKKTLEQHAWFTEVINSLGAGFFIFDSTGKCLPNFSMSCEEYLECSPVGRLVAEVLKIQEKDQQYFQSWIQLLFSGSIDFAELSELGPSHYPRKDGRIIHLDYKPVFDGSSVLKAVVVVISDKTQEEQLQKQVEERLTYATAVIKLVTERNQFIGFVKETRKMINLLAEKGIISENTQKIFDLSEVRRLMHNIKTAAGHFYVSSVKDLAHSFETELKVFEVGGKQENFERLRGQMLRYRESLESHLNQFLLDHVDLLGDKFEEVGQTREVTLDSLYSFADELCIRKENSELMSKFSYHFIASSIKSIFLQYNSLIRQLASYLGKKVDKLTYWGEDVRVIPEVYQELFSSLQHVFNNAIDHGIEPFEERAKGGKNTTGKIEVTVFREIGKRESWLHITIEDDGRGIDADKVREKLRVMGKEDLANSASDQDVIQCVFDADFSTVKKVTDISGRGIGLHAVYERVRQLNGSICVESAIGFGTAFYIRIPMPTINISYKSKAGKKKGTSYAKAA